MRGFQPLDEIGSERRVWVADARNFAPGEAVNLGIEPAQIKVLAA